MVESHAYLVNEGSRELRVTITSTEVVELLLDKLRDEAILQLQCKHYDRAAALSGEANELEQCAKLAFASKSAEGESNG